ATPPPQEPPPALAPLVPDQRQQRSAVRQPPGLRLREREDRRGEVHVRDGLWPLPLRHLGHAYNQPEAPRRLIHPDLPVADPMLSVEEAVVRGEDENRVRELALVLEGIDQLPDHVVDRSERLEPGPVARGDPRLSRRSDRIGGLYRRGLGG